ncbi:MAG: DEAD/DEAH box helicase [Solirubrobacteraceae bacterium]|nr:DEAD/DEAH box helicase [Solirubrobacteraceae bacterium]
MTDFADLGLSEPLLRALQDLGYERPSPIQAQAIPALLSGQDMIGQAQTGSGKTAAFGLPLLEAIDAEDNNVQALVLTPTRELCIQVTQALRAYGARKGVEVVATFGGAPIRTQQAQLKGAQVVVGTVGRVLDLISRHSLILHDCRWVVLDEADEMLDLGFLEDVEKILKLCPNGRQTALFSATMPPPIAALADNYLYDPALVKVKSDTLTVDRIDQFHLVVSKRDKADKLVEVVKSERPEQAIVFCRTKIGCDQLYRKLRDGGMNVKALHGDMSQGSRDGVMLSFKGGRVAILVATDVAARGLDINSVTHVINYDVPVSPDVYVHRIGRTGRAGRSGRAITFVEPSQMDALEAIERHVNDKVPDWAPGKVSARFAKDGALEHDAKDSAATDEKVAAADAAEKSDAPAAEEPKKRAPRTRRKKTDEAPAADETQVEAPAAEASPEAEAPSEPVAEPSTNGAAASATPEADTSAADSDEDDRPRRRRGRRSRKPGLSRGEGPLTSVVAQVGNADGVSVADIVRAITDAAAVDGEVVQDVRVRERFTLLRVPTAELETVLGSEPTIDGRELALVTLN